MSETTVQITAPHFCAALVGEYGWVTQAAPILHYMMGWSGFRVGAYCKRQGWAWQRVAPFTPRE